MRRVAAKPSWERGKGQLQLVRFQCLPGPMVAAANPLAALCTKKHDGAFHPPHFAAFAVRAHAALALSHVARHADFVPLALPGEADEQGVDDWEPTRPSSGAEGGEEGGELEKQVEDSARDWGSDFDGQGLWPFLSTTDRVLSGAAAGEFWPYRPHRETPEGLQKHLDDDATPLGAALVAQLSRGLPEASPEFDVLRMKLQSVAVDQVPSFTTNVLLALISGLSTLPLPEEGPAHCSELLREATGQVLQPGRRLHPRHACRLLESAGRAAGCGRLKSAMGGSLPVLRAAQQAFSNGGRQELSTLDAVAALDGLARLRAEPYDADEDAMLSDAALAVAAHLRGAKLATSVLGYSGKYSEVRALSSLTGLPEVMSHTGVTKWLATMAGIEWPKSVADTHARTQHDGTSTASWPYYPMVFTARSPAVHEVSLAQAACTLARCGNWTAARCDVMLEYVLRRHGVGTGTEEGECTVLPLPPRAAALWMCAAAQAGVPMDSAARYTGATDIMLDSISELVNGADASPPGTPLDMARSLWALHAMDKQDERDGLGAKLLDALASADSSQFSAEAWALLMEVGTSLGKIADSEAEDQVETTDDASPFDLPEWASGLKAARAAEWRRHKAAVDLGAMRAEIEQAAVDIEGFTGDIEYDAHVGPYPVAARISSLGLFLDFDVHASFVSRALRRKQWPALAPDLRPAELALPHWLQNSGRCRTSLLSRRLKGEEDPTEDDEDDD